MKTCIHCGHTHEFHSIMTGKCPDGMHYITLEPVKMPGNGHTTSNTVEIYSEDICDYCEHFDEDNFSCTNKCKPGYSAFRGRKLHRIA